MRALISTIALTLVTGCSLGESEAGSQAEIVVTSVVQDTTDYGPIALQLQVHNIGAAGASKVLVRSYPAKSGDDLTAGAVTYFNLDSGIATGDSAYGEAVLWGVSSHADYDTIRYFIDWTTQK